MNKISKFFLRALSLGGRLSCIRPEENETPFHNSHIAKSVAPKKQPVVPEVINKDINHNVFQGEEVSQIQNDERTSSENQVAVRGYTAVVAHKKQGIPPTHIQALQDLAGQIGPFAIRPFGPGGTTLILEGYATKPLGMKFKSGVGIFEGLITFKQKYGKAGGDPATMERLAQSAHLDEFEQVNMVLSPARWNELLNSNKFSIVGQEGDQTIIESPNARGTKDRLFAQINKDGFYEIFDEEGPIQLMADSKSHQPLAPDYDMLFTAVKLDSYGNEDMPSIKVSYSEFLKNNSGNNSELAKLYPDLPAFYAKADPHLGVVSPRFTNEVKPKINQALGGPDKVHHGDDSANPVSDPSTNYPSTVFLPPGIGSLDTVCMIQNEDEFAYVIQEVKNAGYHVSLNPDWEPPVASVRRSDFTAARKAIEPLIAKRAEQLQN